MSFQWPEFLWLGAALPLLVALYVYLLRRRKRFADLRKRKRAVRVHELPVA